MSASNHHACCVLINQMSAHVIVTPVVTPDEGLPQASPSSKTTGLRARLRAAQVAARAVTTTAVVEHEASRTSKRGRSEAAPEPATPTDSSKRAATNSRRSRAKRPSAAAFERRRRMSSVDYSEDVEEVDERIDYVEEVEDEDDDDETGATPHPIRRRARRPRRGMVGDASAFESKSSLANRFGGIKW